VIPGIRAASYSTAARTNVAQSLFAGGELGEYWDTGVLGSMWQNTAGTTPASVGNVVQRIDGQKNGKNATQGTSGREPILRQDAASRYYLEFGRTLHYMQVTSSAAYFKFGHDGTGVTVWGVGQSDNLASEVFLATITTNPGFEFKRLNTDPNGVALFQATNAVPATIISANTAANSFPSSAIKFCVATYKTQSGNDAFVQIGAGTIAAGAETGTPSSANAGFDLTVGRPGIGIRRLYETGIINRVLTTAEIAMLYAYARSRYGAA
jgi:hypothetical protein